MDGPAQRKPRFSQATLKKEWIAFFNILSDFPPEPRLDVNGGLVTARASARIRRLEGRDLSVVQREKKMV